MRYLRNMRSLILYTFLLTVATTSKAQSLQFKKAFADTTLAAFNASVHAYKDSGFVIQTSSRVNVNTFWELRLMQVDKTGHPYRERNYRPQTAATAMEAYGYNRDLKVRPDGGLFVVNALVNIPSPYIDKFVVFSTDSQLNILWSKAVTELFTFTRNGLLIKNNDVYMVNRTHTDTSFNGNPSTVLRFDPVLYKFDSIGNLLFGKKYFNYNSNNQLTSIYYTGSGDIAILTSATNRLAAYTPDTVMHGCILVVDTNGNIKYGKRYNTFFPERIYVTPGGQHFVVGFTDQGAQQFPVAFGLFDAAFNPIWIKSSAFTSWANNQGMAVNGVAQDASGNFIIGGDYFQGPGYPFLLKVDAAGNILNSYIYNDVTTPFHTFIKDAHGRYAWVSIDSAYSLLLSCTDTIGELDGCNHLNVCGLTWNNEQTFVTNVNWQSEAINNVSPYPLTVTNTASTSYDYCNDPGQLIADFTLADDTICTGESFSLLSSSELRMGESLWIIRDSATGYYVQKDVAQVQLATPGNYIITHIHNLAGCTDTARQTLTVLSSVAGTKQLLYRCSTDTTPTTLAAGNSSLYYVWNTGDTTPQLQVTTGGTYYCRVNYGCGEVRDSFVIEVQPAAEISMADDTTICADKTPLRIGIDGGFAAYQWNTGEQTNTIAVSTSGTYVLQASNACGTVTDSIAVDIKPLPLANPVADYYSINAGTSIELQACATGVSYIWQSDKSIVASNGSSATVRPLQNTSYTCVVTTEWGCTGVCHYTVSVTNYLLIPTAFSPNGDGVNDDFGILNTNIQLRVFSIYNRWGEPVFTTTNVLEKWSGVYKDISQPMGTYVWHAAYFDGEEKVAKGNVTLIR